MHHWAAVFGTYPDDPIVDENYLPNPFGPGGRSDADNVKPLHPTPAFVLQDMLELGRPFPFIYKPVIGNPRDLLPLYEVDYRPLRGSGFSAAAEVLHRYLHLEKQEYTDMVALRIASYLLRQLQLRRKRV